MKKVLAMILAALMCCTLLASCGGAPAEETAPAEEGQETAAPAEEQSDMVYAVEAGSAGEAVANEKGFQVNSVPSQADALMEVASGTSDAAIIDLLMAGAMSKTYPDLTYEEKLTSEEYGIGCRKDSDLAEYINMVLSEIYADGTMEKIAATYGVEDSVIEQPAAEEFTPAADGDVAYIQDKGTLVVGMTDFNPMDFKDDKGEWVGFDADMAKIVAEKLGVEIEFVELDWDNKLMEIESKNVDVLWNGMTLTEEVTSALTCTRAYCNNAQVIVLPGASEAE